MPLAQVYAALSKQPHATTAHTLRMPMASLAELSASVLPCGHASPLSLHAVSPRNPALKAHFASRTRPQLRLPSPPASASPAPPRPASQQPPPPLQQPLPLPLPRTPFSPPGTVPETPGTAGSSSRAAPHKHYRCDLSDSSKVLYGSVVMVESLDGWFLTVHPVTGAVTVREPEPCWFERRRMPFSRRRGALPPPIYHFRVMHPTDASRFGSAVRYGDPVWLVVVDSLRVAPSTPAAGAAGAAGAGRGLQDAAWKEGSVLAVHMQRGSNVAAFSEAAAYVALGGTAIEGEVPTALRSRASGGRSSRAAAASPPAASPTGQGRGAATGSAEDGSPAPPPTLSALRSFLTASASILSAQGGGGGRGSGAGGAGGLAASGSPLALPRIPALCPVDPKDGLIAGRGLPRAVVPVSPRPRPHAEDLAEPEGLAAVRAAALAQQSSALQVRDKRGAGNLLDRLPSSRLGIVKPLAAYVPVQTFSASGSEGILKDSDSGFVLGGVRNRLAAGLGSFTVVDGQALLMAGKNAAGSSSASASAGTTRAATAARAEGLLNQSIVILGQGYLYVTSASAQGGGGGGGEGMVGGGSEGGGGRGAGAKGSSAGSMASGSGDGSGSPGSALGSPTDAVGFQPSPPPAAQLGGGAALPSSTAGDSCMFIKQASDGCCGGNRRAVFVAAEERGAPKWLEPGDASGAAGEGGGEQRKPAKPVYDRKGGWRLRLLVPAEAAALEKEVVGLASGAASAPPPASTTTLPWARPWIWMRSWPRWRARCLPAGCCAWALQRCGQLRMLMTPLLPGSARTGATPARGQTSPPSWPAARRQRGRGASAFFWAMSAARWSMGCRFWQQGGQWRRCPACSGMRATPARAPLPPTRAPSTPMTQRLARTCALLRFRAVGALPLPLPPLQQQLLQRQQRQGPPRPCAPCARPSLPITAQCRAAALRATALPTSAAPWQRWGRCSLRTGAPVALAPRRARTRSACGGPPWTGCQSPGRSWCSQTLRPSCRGRTGALALQRWWQRQQPCLQCCERPQTCPERQQFFDPLAQNKRRGFRLNKCSVQAPCRAVRACRVCALCAHASFPMG